MTDSDTNRADATASTGDGRRRRGLRSWRVWAAVLLFVGGVALGFVAGGATATWAIYHQAMEALEHPERAPARITDHLRDRLALDDQQAEQIEALLRRRMERIRGWVEMPFVQAMLDHQLHRLSQDIRKVLREEQKPEWERIYQEVRRRVLAEVDQEGEQSRAERREHPAARPSEEARIGETG